MKVALLNRRFTTVGGTEQFLVGLALFLRDAGHEVHVHCNELGHPAPGLHVHHLPAPRVARNLGIWLSSARVEADVVMGLGRCRGADVVRAGGGAHRRWQQLCRPWWPVEPGQWVELGLDRATLRGARTVVTPSERAAQDIVEAYGVPRGRIRVVHNGVDGGRFRPGPGGEGLVFLGTGFARKGLDVAVEVSRRLGRPLTVLGGDSRLGAWRRRHPEVRFMGVVERPESWLGRFDALLLPTRYEPFGNACLEAMACGTPAITSSVNGVSELLPSAFVADHPAEVCDAVEGALAGGASTRARCRELALSWPRDRAYQAVEEILVESTR